MNTYVLITGFYYTYIADSVKSSKSEPLPILDVSVGLVSSFHSSFVGCVTTENRAASYANYSGMLTPEIMVLHEKAVRSIYERDVLSNRLEGAYMGIWQFHHAAEAFRHPIGSVYPRKTNQILRKDLN